MMFLVLGAALFLLPILFRLALKLLSLIQN